jgi:hypothetical protein
VKEEYSIRKVNREQCVFLLRTFHYLTAESKGFKSGFNVGLFHRDMLVGVCIFTALPVPELSVSMFGLARDDQSGLWELSRLVLDPLVQHTEHNLASWFVSRALRKLKSDEYLRAVLSYADTRFHAGVVYAASNFTYCGLTAPKADWFVAGVKLSRGVCAGVGEWRPRPQKHRFVKIFDNKLNLRWQPQVWFPALPA